jgi:FKBP-type peptidyl-prolyl cis-trans isomerase
VVPTGEPRSKRPAAIGVVAAIAVLGLLTGCGSGGSETITLGNENTADQALANSNAGPLVRPEGTNNGPTATTPTSGPLSKKPTVTPPAGPPPSKLVVKDLITGTGAEARANRAVTVNYVGVLYHGGKEFDSSWQRGKPSYLFLEKGRQIAGFTEGIPGMKVGGRRELIVPAALAYGAKGVPGKIPPNEPVVFVVDLVGA